MAEITKVKPLGFWQRTFSSLRYRDYRLVWLGSCTEHLGENMEVMAMTWLLMEMTDSPYYLGLLGVCRVAPLIAFSLIGGVLSDRYDRRKVLISCLLGSAVLSIALLVLFQSGAIAPWHILAAGAVGAALVGINHPARAAILPNVTPKEDWMNAVALDTISVRTAITISAPVAGFFIAGYGTGMLFGVRALGMGLAIVWLLMARVPSTHTGGKREGSWRNLSQGLKYAVSSGLIMALVFVFALREFQAEINTIFLPFFAVDILQSGALGFGYLNMAVGLGSIVGLFGIATLGNFRYKGWLIIGSGLSLGVLLSVFPLSNWLVLSILLLFLVNAAGTIFENVSRTALQIIVPDDMRGRVMSLRELMRGLFGTWMAYGLGLGGEHLGVVTASLILGVFLIISVSLMAFLIPSFRRL